MSTVDSILNYSTPIWQKAQCNTLLQRPQEYGPTLGLPNHAKHLCKDPTRFQTKFSPALHKVKEISSGITADGAACQLRVLIQVHPIDAFVTVWRTAELTTRHCPSLVLG